MFAVLFEVRPKRERLKDYLDLAKLLRPRLEAIDGFVENERFTSRDDHGRILLFSIWRDEKALIRWRTDAVHHGIQEQGRFDIFEHYRLRDDEITDDGDAMGALPQYRFDETVNRCKAVTITEVKIRGGAEDFDEKAVRLRSESQTSDLIGAELFESIGNPGNAVLPASWRDVFAATWTPVFHRAERIRHRRVRIVRDYGMSERDEAPQYYAPVSGPPAG
jgi:heme-degrading monooxygenase HmoA